MNHEIKPIELLYLWRLAAAGGGAWLKGTKPELDAPSRKRLEASGLIEQAKQRNPNSGRPALFVSLTDKGWGWLGDHLDADLSSRSPAGTEVLRLLLLRLKTFLDHKQLSLGDLIAGGEPETPVEAGSEADGDGDFEGRVTSAYYALSKGASNVRVRLADLRRRTATIPRAELDRTLFALESSGKASLFRLDDPNEIGPEDREAVLRTLLGEERHIIYLGGRGS